MGTTDMTGSTNIQSAGNTAWLMYNLWDLYQTSGDKQLLADELYPIMQKSGKFLYAVFVSKSTQNYNRYRESILTDIIILLGKVVHRSKDQQRKV